MDPRPLSGDGNVQPQAKLRPRPKRIVVHQNQNSSKPSCLSFLSQCEEVLHAASHGSLSFALAQRPCPNELPRTCDFKQSVLNASWKGRINASARTTNMTLRLAAKEPPKRKSITIAIGHERIRVASHAAMQLQPKSRRSPRIALYPSADRSSILSQQDKLNSTTVSSQLTVYHE